MRLGPIGRVLRAHPIPIAIGVMAIIGAIAFLLLDRDEDRAPASPSSPGGVIAALRASVPLHLRLRQPEPVRGPSYPIATVRSGHTIALHASPGGGTPSSSA
jgi:hypothetical protein